MSTFRIAAVIPARLSSTRLSRKVLRPIAGRPMVEWVWRAAAASGLMDPVVVATDSEEVASVCRERGIPVAMTSPDCPSGSDRVREVAADAIRIMAAVQTRGSARIAGHHDLCSFDATVSAARLAYQQAGIQASDVDFVELHDCFATAELCSATYDERSGTWPSAR